jgi:hypothetical protein
MVVVSLHSKRGVDEKDKNELTMGILLAYSSEPLTLAPVRS